MPMRVDESQTCSAVLFNYPHSQMPLRPVPASCLLRKGSWLEEDSWQKYNFQETSQKHTFWKITWLYFHHFCRSHWSSDWAPPTLFLIVEAILVSTVHIWVYWIFADVCVVLRILLMYSAVNSLFSQLVWRQMNIFWSWDCNLCSAGFTESKTAVLFHLPFPGPETVNSVLVLLVLYLCLLRDLCLFHLQ